MAYLMNDGTKIYWQEQGEGEALLFIAGLGNACDVWHRATAELSRKFRTIVFDNRGMGRSDAPPGPYAIATMAEDAAAVLEAAGVAAAHVFGHSMGGMIAQELALRRPEKTRSLILGGTYCGGQRAVRAAPEVIDKLMARAVNPVEAFWAMAPHLYDASTPRWKLEEDLEVRSRAFPTRESYLAQLQAIMTWESFDRLNSIHAPTLVLHGETDQLIPVVNADILAQAIKGAKLVKLSAASHTFLTDKTEATTAAVLSFLQEAS
jgi:3-oxoadipate enol-lactonase